MPIEIKPSGKRILMITTNYAPEPNGTGKYNGELINWLAARGYDCTVLTTYPYYPEWQVSAAYRPKKYFFSREYIAGESRPVRVYRCPHYVPALPSGKKRVLQDFSFSLAASGKMMHLLLQRRYDVVITIAPSFHLGLLAAGYKTLRRTRFIYHVQDMQIEAARNLGMLRSPWLLQQLFRLEKFILRKADVVSSISPQMVSSIAAKANRDVQLFPNWVDVTRYFPINNRAALKEQFGFPADSKIILYSGALGEKQGLETMLAAARQLKHDRCLRFVICGDGPYKQQLAALAAEWGLKNISFLPLQPASRFNLFLNMADLHLVIQKGQASDLVMPSKLTTILAVGGVPIVTANEGSGLYELISKHRIGIAVKADDATALSTAIVKALQEETVVMAENARRYALEQLALDGIMERFERTILQAP
ncbi:WcaI family glycosyltransferase [Chitinophaga qingshengii]|uniref:WcaI family glycosyltransferase n=1 Tax=Chitinophaga qingshengii TaxID=1569794 RepID=A0ABR7THJ3_9BACT|nr:WcaI family glycosyltransferase [Chitinophaga qingshengii]MBC9929418.1 WcaI family glycosyltransferase [Chitinophaga qingshengii]